MRRCMPRTPSSSNGLEPGPRGRYGSSSIVMCGREHRLAERVDQEGRLAIQRAAAGGLYEVAEQAARQRRFEQHRALARRRACARQAGPARAAPHSRRSPRGTPVRRARGEREPVVALHAVGVARDRRHRDRVARVRIAGDEVARVREHEVTRRRVHVGAFRIDDARTDREGRGLAALRQADRLVRIEQPRMEQIDIARMALEAYLRPAGRLRRPPP